jgi:hypothetical protein
MDQIRAPTCDHGFDPSCHESTLHEQCRQEKLDLWVQEIDVFMVIAVGQSILPMFE